MTHIDKHATGSFCWIELATTDQSAAKKFYSELFGWSPDDSPMGPDEFYTIFKLDSRDAAAGYTLRADQRAQHVPPHWLPYLSVESADQSADKCKQLGGTVLVGPMDVMEAGRMAVLQDPTGAYFCVWQPARNPGIGIAGVHGTLCWADLSTPDAKRASAFYSGLFGWKIMAGENDKSGYLHIKNGEQFIGGIPPAEHQQPGVPPHWLAYFWVDDVDNSAAKAKKLGANIYAGPMTIENVGRMAIIADPQGASFAIFNLQRS
jgi:predicted enzyme related to lactoylglutathione lyase